MLSFFVLPWCHPNNLLKTLRKIVHIFKTNLIGDLIAGILDPRIRLE